MLPWILIGFGCWLFMQLMRQNGRVLLQLEALEDSVAEMAESLEEGHAARNGHRPLARSKINRDGLTKGTEAPDFRLSALEGGELSLADYRGRSVLLVFSDPHCGPCD